MTSAPDRKPPCADGGWVHQWGNDRAVGDKFVSCSLCGLRYYYDEKEFVPAFAIAGDVLPSKADIEAAQRLLGTKSPIAITPRDVVAPTDGRPYAFGPFDITAIARGPWVITGSMGGVHTITLAQNNSGEGYLYCTCAAWKFGGGSLLTRRCKHTDQIARETLCDDCGCVADTHDMNKEH